MLSVIIPLYNCEDYIEDCLESVIAQSYEDFEVILVNDGSTDQSVEVAKRVQDSRIRIISQKNRGLFHARITGLRAAVGEYCIFLDADDLLRANALELLVSYFDQSYDCVIYTLANFYDGDTTIVKPEPLPLPDQTTYTGENRNQLLKHLLTTNKFNSIVCKAFHRSLINLETLSIYPRIQSGEDALFTLELFQHTRATIFVDQPIYLYRQRMNSISRRLTYNLYTDNIFRYQLYHNVALNYYIGTEYTDVDHTIDHQTFRLVISLILNNRYKIENFEVFRNIFVSVQADNYFSGPLRKKLSHEKLPYRLILTQLYNGRYRLLYAEHKAVNLLLKLRRQ